MMWGGAVGLALQTPAWQAAHAGIAQPRANGRWSATMQVAATAKRKVVVIGAGWGGLSVANQLSMEPDVEVTVVDAAARAGGLVSDSFLTPGGRRAEAGQHGFWAEYGNIFALIDSLQLPEDPLTGYAEQGQYSPAGLEAVWPVYNEQKQQLPTGLGQALYTREWPPLEPGTHRAADRLTPCSHRALTGFLNLPITDLATAAPLVLAFSEFDDSPEAWARYDKLSFLDLCMKLGVSQRTYDEVFEPMVLTGLFAPGNQCSAAAALGMAYFFVLKHQARAPCAAAPRLAAASLLPTRACPRPAPCPPPVPTASPPSQTSFDVKWCKGNVGEKIFQPWVEQMRQRGVTFLPSTRATGFVTAAQRAGASGGPADAAAGSAGAEIAAVQCSVDGAEQMTLEADTVVFAVGAQALASMVRGSPELSCHAEWRRYSRLRGTSVLATRLYLDQTIKTPHTANACWGFDAGVGMTWFDIGRLHELEGEQGSVIEVDYYHAQTLLPMDDAALTAKAKADLDTMLGSTCRAAKVVDAAIVRLPAAVNWYYPGSYVDLPDLRSKSTRNAFFVGDLVKSRHGSWSQVCRPPPSPPLRCPSPQGLGGHTLSHSTPATPRGRRKPTWLASRLPMPFSAGQQTMASCLSIKTSPTSWQGARLSAPCADCSASGPPRWRTFRSESMVRCRTHLRATRNFARGAVSCFLFVSL